MPGPENEDREIARAERRDRARALAAPSAVARFRQNLTPNAAFRDDAAILAFEAAHPDPGGQKSELIRRTFRCSEPRYYARLYHLIHEDAERALAIDAVTVHRLLRREQTGAEARARRLSGVINDDPSTPRDLPA